MGIRYWRPRFAAHQKRSRRRGDAGALMGRYRGGLRRGLLLRQDDGLSRARRAHSGNRYRGSPRVSVGVADDASVQSCSPVVWTAILLVVPVALAGFDGW